MGNDGLGANVVDRFFFLGEGYYYVYCTSPLSIALMITRQVVRGASFHNHCMPWDADFDPSTEYMTCPVWVTLKAFPPFMAPLLHDIAATMGKVLYCLLWILSS